MPWSLPVRFPYRTDFASSHYTYHCTIVLTKYEPSLENVVEN